MGADTGKIYRIYKIPAGLSGFFSGLKVAATYCVSGAVVGEWLSAQAGLGYYMIRVKTATRSIKFCCDHLCHSIEFIAEWRLFIIEKGYYRMLYIF